MTACYAEKEEWICITQHHNNLQFFHQIVYEISVPV